MRRNKKIAIGAEYKSGRSTVAERMSGAMAIDRMAMSIYWDWGCGIDNQTRGASRVVTIDGPLQKESCWYDGYDAILERFKEACADEATTSVILRMSSPGGEVSGLYECVDAMRAIAIKAGKRIVAVADDCAYSAAYALACVASEIYLSRTSGVGSIGVLCAVSDYVGMNQKMGVNVVVVHAGDRKVDGHPDVPLSDDAVAVFQSQVNRMAEMFYELVGNARGLTSEDVAALQAATFMGDEALAADLADGVMSFDQVVAMLASDAKQTTKKEDDEEAMGKKNRGKTAAEYGATDPYATAAVAAPGAAALALIAADVSAGATVPSAAHAPSAAHVAETAEPDAEAEDTDEEAAADDGDDADEKDDDDGDDEKDDDEGDEKDKDDKDASAARRSISASSSSADVLRAVRDMTGESSPAAQIGALFGMRDKASSADRTLKEAHAAKRAAAKTEKATIVRNAIASGQLAPSQKQWAMGSTLASLKAYLKSAPKALVRKTATPHGTPVRSAGANPDVDAATAAIAKACNADVGAVQKHAAELRAKGLIN